MGSADSFQELLLLPDANQWDSQLTSQYLLTASRTSADNSTTTLVYINITNFLPGNQATRHSPNPCRIPTGNIAFDEISGCKIFDFAEKLKDRKWSEYSLSLLIHLHSSCSMLLRFARSLCRASQPCISALHPSAVDPSHQFPTSETDETKLPIRHHNVATVTPLSPFSPILPW